MNMNSYSHFRCLTDFLGYPDDVALKVQCKDGQTIVWWHAQSRLAFAEFDFGVNDARLRLIKVRATN
jgi:uncharacterized protein (DUF1499 family)